MGVVGIAGREVSERRFALHLDVVLVIIDLEHGFRCLHHLPHHDGRNLDRVAVAVIDFELAALEIADAL